MKAVLSIVGLFVFFIIYGLLNPQEIDEEEVARFNSLRQIYAEYDQPGQALSGRQQVEAHTILQALWRARSRLNSLEYDQAFIDYSGDGYGRGRLEQTMTEKLGTYDLYSMGVILGNRLTYKQCKSFAAEKWEELYKQGLVESTFPPF